jgi:MYXO-CTERM domain-containing protein
VRTLVITSPASSPDVAVAVPYLDRAEAVFFAGGDQADYVGWRGDLLLAVQRAYDRGAVIGGTSAGADILGQFVNDALGERSSGATRSADAIADPFEPSITLSHDLLRFAPLAGAIVDTHFRARDRFGRLGAYMARIAGAPGGPPRVVGIGVDEGSALVVDRDGKARLLTGDPASGGAWIVGGGDPARLASGQPLGYAPLAVTRLDTSGASFDLARGCGDGVTYAVSIDGARGSPYVPAVPYDGTGTVTPCAAAPVPGPEGGVDAGGRGAAAIDGTTQASGCACSSTGEARRGPSLVAGALALAALVLGRRASRRAARGGSP